MADDYAASTGTTGTVSVGGTKTGVIETTGDTDWFRTSLIAGHIYQVEVEGSPTGQGTLADAYGSLRNSSGTKVAEADDGGTGFNTRFTYTVPSGGGGTYYVAAGSNNNGTGNYRIKLTDITPPAVTDDYAASTSTTGTVSVDGSKTGNIETTGDTDWFRTSLVAGHVYQVDVEGSATSQGTLADPYGSLRNSSGTKVAEDDDGGTGFNSRFSYTVPAGGGGTYYVAAGSNNSATGSYRVRLTDVTPVVTDDYSSTTSTSGTVSVGGSKTGNLEVAGDTDWFRTSLTPGRTYQIDVEGSPTGSGTLADAYGSIRDSSGTKVAESDDGGTGFDSRFTYTVPSGSDGTFYVAAGSNNNGTGTYRVRVSDVTPAVTDDYGSSTSTTGTVSVGSSKTGSIETTGDTDWFSTSLIAGHVYQVDVEGSPTGQGTLADPYGSLRNSVGTKVAEADDGGTGFNTRFTYTVPGGGGGTYFVAAGSNTSGIGTYRVRLTDLTTGATDDYASSTSTTGTVSVGGSKTGNLETVGDTDWFRTTLTPGKTYQIDVEGSPTGNGTLTDPYGSIRNSAGTKVAEADDGGTGFNTRFSYAVPGASDGIFYIAAGSNNNGTGTYRVRVTEVTNPTPAGDDFADEATDTSAPIGNLSPGGSISGVIGSADANDQFGDKDVFRVSLVAGQAYQFRLQSSAASGSALPSGLFTVRDPSNFDDVRLTSGSGSSLTESFIAEKSGLYYVRVGSGGSSTDRGGYVLSVSAATAASGTTYSITPSSLSVTEGTQLVFTITRSGDKPDATVYFSTLLDGTATYGEGDYTTTSGGRPDNIPVHFLQGDPMAMVTLNIRNDGISDSGEQFRAIVQSAPSNSATPYLSRSAYVRINDQNQSDDPTAVNPQSGVLNYFATVVRAAESEVVLRIPVGDGSRVTEQRYDGTGQQYDDNFYQTNDLGIRYSPQVASYHLGEDWNFFDAQTEVGQPVYTMGEGVVVYAGPHIDVAPPGTMESVTFGNVVIVQHNLPDGTYYSLYAHLNEITVGLGKIGQNAQVGTIGRTGAAGEFAHLHFEVFSVANGSTYLTYLQSGTPNPDNVKWGYTDSPLANLGTGEVSYVSKYTEGNFTWYNPSMFIDKPRITQPVAANPNYNNGFTVSLEDVGNAISTIAADGRDVLVSVSGTAQDYLLSGYQKVKILGSAAADKVKVFFLGDTTISQDTIYLDGGAGDDLLDGSVTDHSLVAEGGIGDDELLGGSYNDSLTGGEGNDTLNGGPGSNSLFGGIGNDRFFVNGADDAVIELAGEGNDRVYASASYTFGAGVHVETLSTTDDTGTDPLILAGNELDNRIIGNAGANVLYGMGGTDRLEGLAGDDRYVVDTALDAVIEAAGQGYDTVFSPVSYALAAGSEIEAMSTMDRLGTQAIDFTGNEFRNALYGNAGANRLIGGAGNDTLDGGAGDDRLDGGADIDTATYADAVSAVTVSLALIAAQNTGGAGTDTLIDVENLLGSTFADTLTGNGFANVLDGAGGADAMAGGAGHDVYYVDNVGDVVVENFDGGTDELRTTLASYSIASLINIEILTAASDVAHDFRGNSRNNVIIGGGGADILRLYDGGSDIVNAGGGNDNIFFIGTLTAADRVNGGDGVDTLVLQGPYGSLTLTADVTQIENISILGGGNTNFGDPGTNLYDYVITTNDANFAAGVQARINGAALLAGEDFTFDGSAETDASFVVYGGRGRDTLTGGLGNDIFFYAEERFASGDTVNGGSGYDGMFLRGNYTIDFNAPGYTGLFTSIENLTLTSATDERYARGGGSEFDYNITLSNALVGAGSVLTVSGTILTANETMILDGSQETDGFLRLFGGKASDILKGGGQNDLLHGNLGADTLAGGGGADTFRYDGTAESNSASRDQILDFTPGSDKIDLTRIDARTDLAGDQAFAWIGSNAFSGTAGQLRAYQSGGIWFVEGDVNGDSVADLVIALTPQGPTPLGAGDFLL